MENFQRMLRVQIVDTPFRSEIGGIRGFQSLDPSVNRTAVMQHRQSMVPRSDIVAAFGFKIGEESSDIVGAEIGERQFADGVTSRLGHEEKEKADSVAVTSNGCLGKPPLGFEVMLKELVDQAADGRHGWSPVEIGAANRSKRRPAASMRSVVIVRYTAVEIGSTCPMKVESFMR